MNYRSLLFEYILNQNSKEILCKNRIKSSKEQVEKVVQINK